MARGFVSEITDPLFFLYFSIFIITLKLLIMKKALDFIKKIYLVCKTWVIKNGVEGVAGLIAGLFLWTFGYKIWAGFSFGVFATRNWDIVKNWLKDLIK